jgi:MOSC domain-containing protein YiiM
MTPATPTVTALQRSGTHSFSKTPASSLELVAGAGVVGDAHYGATVQHRSRVAVDPTQPNLRQVHLLQSELFAELAAAGFDVAPGDLGENVTTVGVDLLGLATGTVLRLGPDVLLGVTGLRNPCGQIDRFRRGLRAAVIDHDADGATIRRAGVMAVVLRGGTVHVGDTIESAPPPGEPVPLERV